MHAGLRNEEACLLEAHPVPREASICVVGCGSGREVFAFYRLGFHHIVGIDCTPELLDIARQRGEKDGLPVRFELATASAIPSSDASFDLITFFENVYGHITPRAERLKTLNEAHRALKPGGVCFLVVTNMYVRWLYRAYFALQGLTLPLWNPQKLEPGDKVMRDARLARRETSGLLARSHWFKPGEVPDEARQARFSVVHATTEWGLRQNLQGNMQGLRGQGRLVYVLRRE